MATLRRATAPALLVLAALLTTMPSSARADAAPPPSDDDTVELVVFHGDGCPHCAAMLTFLDALAEDHPDLVVTEYEVWYDRDHQRLFAETLAALGETPDAVPTVVIDGHVIVGHTDAIERRIEGMVDDLSAGRSPSDAGQYEVDVPFVGTVDLGSRSMVGATALIALVDGVNPCSLWVLSMLLALVIHSGSRARVALVGVTFLLITSMLYGLYMLGAYSTLAIIGRRTWIRAAVALVAATFGVVHIKEHWTSRGPSVTIGPRHKPGIFQKMRRLADIDRSLAATLGGTAVLAIGVSLLETPCSAGLPLLWTDLVAEREVPISGAAVLFALYLAIFLLDELVIFGAAVATMRAAKLQERHGQALHLVGGTLMLTLAAAMLFAPRLLETIGGTIAVFGIAAAATVVVMAAESWWRHRHPPTRQGRRAHDRARARA